MIPVPALKVIVYIMASAVTLLGCVFVMVIPLTMTSSEAWSGKTLMKDPLILGFGAFYTVLGAGLVYSGLRPWFRWSQPTVSFMKICFDLILFILLVIPIFDLLRDHLSGFWLGGAVGGFLTVFWLLERRSTKYLCQKLFPASDSLHGGEAATASS